MNYYSWCHWFVFIYRGSFVLLTLEFRGMFTLPWQFTFWCQIYSKVLTHKIEFLLSYCCFGCFHLNILVTFYFFLCMGFDESSNSVRSIQLVKRLSITRYLCPLLQVNTQWKCKLLVFSICYVIYYSSKSY